MKRTGVGSESDRIIVLEDALVDAIECVEDWAAYAPEYFVEKWDLAGDVARLRSHLKGTRYE